MTQFKTVLDSVKLDDRHEARIDAAIRKAVLAELADIDTHGDLVAASNYGPWIKGFLQAAYGAAPPVEGPVEVHERLAV